MCGVSETFGERMRSSRKANNLTLKELADELGVKLSFLAQIEYDIEKPSTPLAERIQNFLEG